MFLTYHFSFSRAYILLSKIRATFLPIPFLNCSIIFRKTDASRPIIIVSTINRFPTRARRNASWYQEGGPGSVLTVEIYAQVSRKVNVCYEIIGGWNAHYNSAQCFRNLNKHYCKTDSIDACVYAG